MSPRDFNSPSDDPIALHNSPQGNGGGLGNFHTTNPEDREPNNTPKIVGALAVALMIGAAGVGLFAYTSGASNKPMVTANAAMPAPVVPPAPDAQPETAMTPAADTSAPIPAATDTKPAPIAPVKSASAKQIRSTSTASSAPVEAAAVQQAAAIPEPVTPTPSPNDVAAANTQSVGASPATTASDAPASAQDQQSAATPAPAAPAQLAASPAPAQSAGQVAQ